MRKVRFDALLVYALILIAFVFLFYSELKKRERLEQDRIQGELIRENLRKAGRESARLHAIAQPISVQDETESLSEQDDSAQAKYWSTLSPKGREEMTKNFFSGEQHNEKRDLK